MDASDVVVWAEPEAAVPVERVGTAHVQLLQKNKMFAPHVLAIQIGTVVDFPNADPIFHSAFSNYDGQLFDLALYPPGVTKSVRFHRAGIVRVFCNIHPSMSALIVVLDVPYFSKAASDGSYRIPDVPPGKYALHVFDERAARKALPSPQIAISSQDEELQMPPIQISEKNYVPLAHKNKYGQDYPAGSDGSGYGVVPK